MTDTSETRSADDAAQANQQSRLRRLMRYIPLIAPVLLWTVPCWVLLHAYQHWPLPVALGGTALFVLGLVAMPLAMVRGHGRMAAGLGGDRRRHPPWGQLGTVHLVRPARRPAAPRPDRGRM